MEDEQGLEASVSSKPLTFAEFADEMCPYYLQMGVPYHEYWHGDYTQLRHYAEAYKLKVEHENYNAWLQGAYIYDALCAVSPVFHAFAKKGTKPTPYHKQPYGVEKNDEADETIKKPKEEIQAINAAAKFSAMALNWNKRFAKGGENSGD